MHFIKELLRSVSISFTSWERACGEESGRRLLSSRIISATWLSRDRPLLDSMFKGEKYIQNSCLQAFHKVYIQLTSHAFTESRKNCNSLPFLDYFEKND